MLGAARILAAQGIKLSALQAFKIVGMFLPTEWAQHQHVQTRELFGGIQELATSRSVQEFPVVRQGCLRHSR